jgi:3-phenylpropionate/trans-cinnamate dioxygenase ferredoxin component
MAAIEVAREEDLPPGSILRVWVDDEPVGVYNVNGELYAIGDTCTHEDFSLSDGGIVEDHTVECALHGSRFDLRTGKALGMPATGAVPTYRVWIEDGAVMVEPE